MSHIDDALRLAGAPAAEPSTLGAAGADVFVSPWTAGGQSIEGDSPRESSPDLLPVRPSRRERFNPVWRDRLTISSGADPLLVHQFHRLAAILLRAQRTRRLKSVMITSSAPHDGKTLTSLNLALVLSGSYRLRVLLIEGDLRRPAIAAAANLPPGEGLSDTLKGVDDRKVPLIQLTDTLTLLQAGRPDPDPLSGLTSPRMLRLMREASEEFDWVILDTPPLGPTADAGLLCPLVDAAILVVRAGQTPCAAVQTAIDTLGRDRILGVVLNAVDYDVASGYDATYADY
jgi:capsular exopolysaccharide synthesis family protein